MTKILGTIILAFVFISCEESDSTPPNVTILTPSNGSIVYEGTTISVMASDNEEVSQIELWVDGIDQSINDKSEPYSLDRNTTSYNDNSDHIIVVRATDNSDNVTDSKPISLTVDNSQSFPQRVDIISILLDEGGLKISWTHSNEVDFGSYSLEKSVDSAMLGYSGSFGQ